MQRTGRGRLWYGFKCLSAATAAGLAVVFMAATAPSAQADPHAMFYTAIGQQQLFFNLLAALDQADYVEPATGPNSREQLMQKRTATNFGPEQNPSLNATKTDLAGVVTRLITLEGNDLWSSFLANELALESARRNASDELERIFCERGLGRVGCSSDAGTLPPKQVKDKAFVTDPLARAAEVANAVNGVFESGTDYDKSLREKIADPDDKSVPKEPRLYDSFMAQLRANAEQGPDSDTVDAQKSAVERLAAAGQNVADKIDPTVYQGIKVDADGYVSMDDNLPPTAMFDKMDQWINNTQNVLSTGLRAQNQMATIKSSEENQGSLADSHTKAQTDPQTAGSGQPLIKTITSIIDTPASAKLAMINELAATLSRQTTDIKHAPADAANNPGNIESVERDARGAVHGTRSDQGEVKGIYDIIYSASGLYDIYKYYDQNKQEAINPDDNLVAPQLEKGSRDALKALTNDTYRLGDPADQEACGFCLLVESDIWKIIKSVGNMICIMFPSLPFCQT